MFLAMGKGVCSMTGSVLLWVVIAAIAIAIDLITSAFLFVWFAVGSIAAIVARMFHFSFTIQLIVFVTVSFVFMLIGYPMVKDTIKKTVKRTKTMEENYIGRVIIVDEEVIEKAHIKIDGIYWTVKKVGEPIKKGDKVKVTGIEGNKMLIEKCNDEGGTVKNG